MIGSYDEWWVGYDGVNAQPKPSKAILRLTSQVGIEIEPPVAAYPRGVTLTEVPRDVIVLVREAVDNRPSVPMIVIRIPSGSFGPSPS